MTKAKILFFCTSCVFLFLITYSFCSLQLSTFDNAGAIGIIGGAVGPTAIFVSSKLDWVYLSIRVLGLVTLLWSARVMVKNYKGFQLLKNLLLLFSLPLIYFIIWFL